MYVCMYNTYIQACVRIEKTGQGTGFSLEDPFGLLAGSDRIRGNGRSKSYHRHSIPSTSLFLSCLFTVSPFPATLLPVCLKLVPSHLLILFGISPFFIPLIFTFPIAFAALNLMLVPSPVLLSVFTFIALHLYRVPVSLFLY